MRRAELICAILAGVVMCFLLSGCATGPDAKAAEAVPISIKVTPILTDPLNPQVEIETTLNATGVTDYVLLYYYDVRDDAGVDPHLHLDADDFLKLDDNARMRRFTVTGNKYTILVSAKSARALQTTLNIIVMSETYKRGASGKATLPATASQ